jgi:hypothetical protein
MTLLYQSNMPTTTNRKANSFYGSKFPTCHLRVGQTKSRGDMYSMYNMYVQRGNVLSASTSDPTTSRAPAPPLPPYRWYQAFAITQLYKRPRFMTYMLYREGELICALQSDKHDFIY